MTLRLLLVECWICIAADSDSLICVQTHLPGYVNDYSKLSEAGAQVIACVAVNDAFVMKAWGEQSGAEAKVSWSHLMNIPKCVQKAGCFYVMAQVGSLETSWVCR